MNKAYFKEAMIKRLFLTFHFFISFTFFNFVFAQNTTCLDLSKNRFEKSNGSELPPNKVVDPRYGSVSQDDSYFARIGLTNPNRISNLCQPTSAHAAIEKLLVARGVHLTPSNKPTDIENLIVNEYANLGKSVSNWTTQGVNSETTAQAILHRLGSLGLNPRVKILTSALNMYRNDHASKKLEIRSIANQAQILKALKLADSDDSAVLINFQSFQTNHHLSTVSASNIVRSHTVAITGYDLFDPLVFYFKDPHFPKITRSFRIGSWVMPDAYDGGMSEIILENHSNGKNLDLKFYSNADDLTSMIESVMIIQVK